MVSITELDKFVVKFKSLLESGSDAKLIVDAVGGVAKISLHVDVMLKPQPNHASESDGASSRRNYAMHNGGGGSPSRQRRRLRREAERKSKATAAAEEVAAKSCENVDEGVVAEMNQAVVPTADVEFEIIVDTQKKICNYEITEAFEENFYGALGAENVAGKDSYGIYVYRSKVDLPEDVNVADVKNFSYRIFVTNHEKTLNVVNNWQKPGYFDDLAFGNAIKDGKSVRIREVKRMS